MPQYKCGDRRTLGSMFHYVEAEFLLCLTLHIPCQLAHVLLEHSSVSISHITTGVLVLQNHITTSTSLRWVSGIKFHLSALPSGCLSLAETSLGHPIVCF